MLLEVKFESDSFIVEVDREFEASLNGKIPFTTELNVWKEEVYFETPIEIDTACRRGLLKVEPGKLYYWPPGRGFCIFYGVSQPYSLVYPIGLYIGVLARLRAVEDGAEASINRYKPNEKFEEITSRLEKIGFKASTPLYDGEPTVEALGFHGDIRIAFRVYVEDYGFHLEGEPLYVYGYDPFTVKATRRLAEAVGERRFVRLDLDEDGWVTVTGYVEKKEELEEAVEEFIEAYKAVREAYRTLGFPG